MVKKPTKNLEIMIKKGLFTAFMVFTLIALNIEKAEATPHSYCTSISEIAVYNYAQGNPNATLDDLFNIQVTSYSLCRVYEDIYQYGNW